MTRKEQNNHEELFIRSIEAEEIGNEKMRVNVLLDNGKKKSTLWYEFDKSFEPFLCIDRCDAVIVTLFLAAMKFGYEAIKTDYPISEKLYFNLMYHAIPQLYDGGHRHVSRLRIEAPITKEVFNGKLNATGMSRGVDSFATMYEYGERMELEDYRINLFTYFQVGAHHGRDPFGMDGEESAQDLYQHQMEKTSEFCKKYGYPLLVVESNIDEILADHQMFWEWSFDRTHTCRNLGIATLFQRGIHRYYYSSTYTLTEFSFSLDSDIADYEKWLIPHFNTGSIDFYSSNQEWTRMEKVERIAELKECYDYLQVCFVKSGNCGKCMKCKRTLLELDALGGDILDRFEKSFDLETYKREDRKKWFSSLIVDKDRPLTEAHHYDDSFLCAVKRNPALIGNLIQNVEKGVRSVVVQYNIVNIRELPSKKAEIVDIRKKGERLEYLGECGIWVAVRLENGKEAYLVKKSVLLSSEVYNPARDNINAPRFAIIKVERANLREYPGFHELIVGFGYRGDRFRFQRDLDGWVAIDLPDGKRAYVIRQAVELSRK